MQSRRTRYRAVAAFAVGLMGAMSLGSSQVVKTVSAGNPAPWLDATKSIADRVDALLKAMTLAEKVGQMDMQEVTQITDKSNNCTSQGGFNLPNPVCVQQILITNHTGAILAGGTDIPIDTTGSGGPGNKGVDWANEYNTIQQLAIKDQKASGRPVIPVIFGVDAVHGWGHPWEAPLFPQQMGMGATWDPSLAQKGGTLTGQDLQATGWNWDFAPVQDISRDNRWGRSYEAWAEEPALAAALGSATVKGLQSVGGSNSLGVTATLKHFVANSWSINGHDRNEDQVPLRTIQDLFLPAYQAGVDAGAGTVMISSSSLNGTPATASHDLQTELLRNRLGFKGVIISDYADVPALNSSYHIVPDLAGAIAAAVNAGLDVSMEPFNSGEFQTAILQDVASGALSIHRIDDSVRRILTMKFRLGLFDQPCVQDPSQTCVDASKANAVVTSGRSDALKAARESITLLRNQNNVLPLAPSTRVTVTGPSADSMTNQLGGWSVSWQGVFGAGHVCCMGPPNQIPPGTTVKAGLMADGSSILFAPDKTAAVAAAGSTDAYVVAVGEKAYAEGLGDNPAPQLPPDQTALISALEKTGKPVIVVVIAGRPVGLGPGDSANAILMAYQGDTEAGQAVADAIFGKINPSGKLPVSWPSDAAAPGGDFNGGAPSPLGDQPKFFDQLPNTGSGQGHSYNPLFPFGFGLSYNTFSTSGLTVTPSTSRHGKVTATFTVTNNSTSTPGTDIVPVYASQPVSAVVVPQQRLVDFIRVTLAGGQSTTVSVTFPVSVLAVTPGDAFSTREPSVESGNYQVVLDQNTTAPYQVAQMAGFTIT